MLLSFSYLCSLNCGLSALDSYAKGAIKITGFNSKSNKNYKMQAQNFFDFKNIDHNIICSNSNRFLISV